MDNMSPGQSVIYLRNFPSQGKWWPLVWMEIHTLSGTIGQDIHVQKQYVTRDCQRAALRKGYCLTIMPVGFREASGRLPVHAGCSAWSESTGSYLWPYGGMLRLLFHHDVRVQASRKDQRWRWGRSIAQPLNERGIVSDTAVGLIFFTQKCSTYLFHVIPPNCFATGMFIVNWWIEPEKL